MLKALADRVFTSRAVHIRVAGTGFTAGPGEPELTVHLADAATAMAVAVNPELAVGEAFMDGRLTIEDGDIYDFLQLVASQLAVRPMPRGPLWRWKRRLAQTNDRLRARRNVHHHYDLTLEFYRLFLDDDLQYSCALFETPDATLEQAQAAKKRRLIDKLVLRPGHSVLDIGCGWGGLGLSLARAGGQVTGVTLSTEQHATAQARATESGLADRADFRLQDYRDLDGTFDRIISVGMFEHVGLPNYQTYFDAVARLLNEDGVAVIHAIGRRKPPSRTQPWIAKHIFPGGYIPSLSEVFPAIERAGLWVTDMEILRLHYAETLRLWRERFLARRDEAVALYDERFCLMWEFYLASSEVGFRDLGHMVFQIQLSKRQDAVPLTRAYLCD
ncbi:cyclopropane-fatty-acyl-phospholipid synthase family protein [uncultured Brevundimonas sp.]|uniref:cyclopropane-fatty-acyl-phospholipid synthase family protein n=1 Tax=uncultured Brevundimonas sp. TaxID=213418 RepID=UPI0030EE9198|tara:strand:- start:581 stop:1741 length:1161 start_codon:yes stop_codon:yes gene_type:complete